jgi:four helix bundle protein
MIAQRGMSRDSKRLRDQEKASLLTRSRVYRGQVSANPATEPDANDPLWRMRAFRLAHEIANDCWDDADRLKQNELTAKIAGQLYKAVGSIAANIGEGYSRSSGRDRANIFEYALGSTRESMIWYRRGVRILGRDLVDARLSKLEEIRRLLLATIPRERGRLIRPRDP